MNKQRLSLLVIAAVGVVATYLPWAKAPFNSSIKGTELGGWITMALFFVVIVSSIIGDRTKTIVKNQGMVSLAASVLAGLYAAWRVLDLSGLFTNNAIEKVMSSTISIGIGLYLVILAAIGSIIVNIAMKK